MADIAFLTSDNPRSEDPDAILEQMLAGIGAAGTGATAKLTVVPDRAEAIASAVFEAGPDDAVVVAGKGHETGQEQAGVVIPFDDREVLRSALAEWTAGGADRGAQA
jgi:UDP-N-acetylmuramoyl-L-alanyl-D-glutamate--2,6-diaminopimelate ligase